MSDREGWVWQCPYCTLFYSKRTAEKHNICFRMYERIEWEKDAYPTGFGITAAMGAGIGGDE